MKKQLLYFIFLNVACIAFWFFILPTLPELMPRHTNGVSITSYEAKKITAISTCIFVASISLVMYLVSIWILRFRKKIKRTTKIQIIKVINIIQVCLVVFLSMLPLLLLNRTPYSYAAYLFPLVLLYQAWFNPILHVPISGFSQKGETELAEFQLSQTERKVYPLIALFLIIYSIFMKDMTWLMVQTVLLIILVNKMAFNFIMVMKRTNKR